MDEKELRESLTRHARFQSGILTTSAFKIELSEEALKLVEQLASLKKTVEDEITLLAALASRHPQIGQITKTRGADNQDANIISQIKSALEQIEKKKKALAESD